MSLDKDKAIIQAGKYGDSGVLQRMSENLKTTDPKRWKKLNDQGLFGLKKGGRLPKLNTKMC